MFEVYLVSLLIIGGVVIAIGAFWAQRGDRAGRFDTITLPVFLVVIYSGLVMLFFTLVSDNSANGRHTECEAVGINESALEVRMQNHTEFVSCTEIIEAFMEADRQLIRE